MKNLKRKNLLNNKAKTEFSIFITDHLNMHTHITFELYISIIYLDLRNILIKIIKYKLKE